MKIIVSHSQKQHAYRMVYGLKKQGRLVKFFTSLFFAEGGVWTRLFRLSAKTEKLVRKRSFVGIDKNEVFVTLLPELFFQISKYFIPRLRSYYMDRIHDTIVSWFLPLYKYDAIIGYERQCLKSFQKAKKQGKITILDLASIHAQKQREINAQYNNIITGFQASSLLDVEKSVKAEELKYTDYIIVLSDFAKQSCIEAGISEDKIKTFYLGIDTQLFSAKTTYEKEKFEILFVSGIRYFKGIKDLIETFLELNLLDARLTIVGGYGDALDYVKEHEGETIEYIPFLHHDELKKVYQRASIFVLPSYLDSWGQVVCEAMACGTPVIVSQNTGAKDIVRDGESGFIVDVANPNQLADKITYFYENRLEIKRMGKNARKAVEHLTWENYYGQAEALLVHLGTSHA
jgi:glycosyltransferase involved in cell wall biosynthesis